MGTAVALSPGSIATAVASDAREATTNRRTFEYHALLGREPMTVDSTPPNGRGNERQGLAGMLQTPLSATPPLTS